MYKILVIDDDEDSREICQRILSKQKLEVVTLEDGLNAFQNIQSIAPSLILSDWDMPGKGGLELLQELQSDKQLCMIPVIMMTGRFTSSANLRTALEQGASDFISKPINAIELVARVKSALKTYSFFQEKEALIQEIIKQKDREVSIFQANIIRNTQLLTTIKKDFYTLFPISSPYHVMVTKLIEKYENQSNYVNPEINEHLFTTLSSGFSGKLKEKHPDLTQSDLKLCVFLRMGYTYKDISILLYMNYEAVRKAVFRLKKKLKLTHIDELIDLLQELY
jgi:DNA-binding response OmpR family regulator/DNA-binding CsgD family transcriptional regulator